MKVHFSSWGMVLAGVAAIGAYIMKGVKEKQLQPIYSKEEHLLDQYHLLNHWLEIKNEGKSAADYFEFMGYHHIAIYGMAELANRLSEDLAESSVFIDYGIDRDVCCTMARIDKIYYPEEELPETDVVIVTPYQFFEDIRKKLEERLDCPVISIEDVIWSI